MQVNVFVTRDNEQLQSEFPVLPMTPKAPIPKQYRIGWRYFATTDTADAIFGDVDARAIEVELETSGYAIVQPDEFGRH